MTTNATTPILDAGRPPATAAAIAPGTSASAGARAPLRRHGVDCIYLGACAWDGRLTRICVASIRYFYPDIPIRILAGDTLQAGLADELKRHWNVDLHPLPGGDYGSGFVKLEPLFGPPGERFLLIDVDTAFAGNVLDLAEQCDAPFIVDDEMLPDADLKRLYYDWEKLAAIDPDVLKPVHAFNTGQWVGTAGVLTRADFDPLVEWTMPRRLRHPTMFMTGDQGILNYVLIRKQAREGLNVARRKIMRWPGHSLEGLDVPAIAARRGPPQVIHWAGMKNVFLSKMVAADILMFFERYYYDNMPGRRVRRVADNVDHVWRQYRHTLAVRAQIRYRKLTKARALADAPAQ